MEKIEQIYLFFFFYLRHKWNMASQALICDKKALPSPCPSEAPLTRPAISTTFRKAGTLLKIIIIIQIILRKSSNIKLLLYLYTSCYTNYTTKFFQLFFQICIWSRNWFLVEHCGTQRQWHAKWGFWMLFLLSKHRF